MEEINKVLIMKLHKMWRLLHLDGLQSYGDHIIKSISQPTCLPKYMIQRIINEIRTNPTEQQRHKLNYAYLPEIYNSIISILSYFGKEILINKFEIKQK